MGGLCPFFHHGVVSPALDLTSALDLEVLAVLLRVAAGRQVGSRGRLLWDSGESPDLAASWPESLPLAEQSRADLGTVPHIYTDKPNRILNGSRSLHEHRIQSSLHHDMLARAFFVVYFIIRFLIRSQNTPTNFSSARFNNSDGQLQVWPTIACAARSPACLHTPPGMALGRTTVGVATLLAALPAHTQSSS
ncbi:hypothetical protein HPB51_027698 [Rhipicephalus microplus]|uniref:Uncharacterized protein n=1 Tax=Rhipicephalus microplus TaxID=6941 RepID=A0A9J6CZJ4_RHIMP|nr:hypothetical protein HPB51_027698 [Rhipicephalus microplus]